MSLSKWIGSAALGAFASVAAAAPAFAEEAAGRWSGQLPAPVGLHIVLTIEKGADGHYAGSMASPEQGDQSIRATSVEAAGDRLTFTQAAFNLVYEARWDEAKQAWVGVFKQAGQALALELKRDEGPVAKPRRPQEEAIAAAPVPYQEVAVDFDGPTTGVRLAGTLTLPKGKGPFPAVVLVSGSGPFTRDAEVNNHKIFLVLADHLTRQGLAVLRYDKRGKGESKGDYAAATTADFAADAEAAVAYLRSRPDIKGRRVGLVGHSEGGVIAPMVAAKDPRLAFIVMMAGTGQPGRIVLAEQERLINVASGQPQAEADATYALKRKLYDAVAASKDADEARARAREILSAADPAPPPPVADEVVTFAGRAWTRFFVAYDPVPTLRKVRTPVLAMIGEKDLQVPSDNLMSIREALAANRDATVREMADLNHLFQHATTGSPMEYGRIEETLAPELLQTVADWIAARVK